MKKILTAIALAIVIPAMAQAQAAPAPAPAPKADCCEKAKDMACCKDCKMDCCKDMGKMDHGAKGMKAGGSMPAGHDMSQPAAKTPQADSPQNRPQ